MSRGRRAVRAFFTTFYEERAERLLERLREAGLRIRVARSKVVPELYYVDIEAGNRSLEELRALVEKIMGEEAEGGHIYGIKVYTVDASV